MTPTAWTVVGAGPAGIVAVGKLLDHGIPAERIVWIDPDFAVGDFGAKWRAVPSNTAAELFLEYLNGSPSFRFGDAPPTALRDLDPKQTCPLGLVADSLAWITGHLAGRVDARRTTARELSVRDGRWLITTTGDEPGAGISTENVILATGAVPKKLDHDGLIEIPLDVALDPDKLARVPLDGASVAVFGSSHSSMIALPNLLGTPAARVVNFFRSPVKYALRLDGWTLFDDTGLKGSAASWARATIDTADAPERLRRCAVDAPDFRDVLRGCDHVVYTVGFAGRRLPATPQCGALDFDATNGIIAPGLYGLGIGYPAAWTNPLGGVEYRVGLVKFLWRLQEVLPLWLRYRAG